MSTPILEVQNLSTHFFTRKGVLKAVDDVSFTVGEREIVGLVGESGSGKSITGFSILGLIDPPGRVTAGKILFRGEDLLAMPQRSMRAIRGKRIAMIFQDPMMTLNPVLSVGTQMIEAVQAHDRVSKAEARARARDTLGLVGIASPEERLDSYPHQFSGGMRQRVAIAIALLHRPDLIIADEPTTALDVTIQAQIIQIMVDLVRERGLALMLITHDMGVVAQACDKVVVLYAGRVAESNGIDAIFAAPKHPYTRELIRCIPRHGQKPGSLTGIPGAVPSVMDYPAGCRFHPRCAEAMTVCAGAIPALERKTSGFAACHASQITAGEAQTHV